MAPPPPFELEHYLTQAIIDAIDHALMGRSSTQSTFGTNIDCPMCVARGEARPDRRKRCGVKRDAGGVGIHCFNCGFKTRWQPGQRLPANLRDFLAALGVPSLDLDKLILQARLAAMASATSHVRAPILPPTGFPARSLPPGSRPLMDWAADACTDPDYLATVEYLLSRGSTITKHADAYWSPEMPRRLIVPFHHRDAVVGWTARAIDPGADPKYLSEVPSDYLFNNHVMEIRQRKYVLVTEGAFDAISIKGVATLGAKISAGQAAWLKATGKTVIVIPDHDAGGKRLVDCALQHGFNVSFPWACRWWTAEVKDPAEAVKKCGQLFVLMSIVKSAFSDPAEIRLRQMAM